ncbi:MAG TPA: DUF4007 family protein [Burkholderiales bacterium]|nr:DUF4007 family protein [Burkholderiales bacterium]
MKRFETTKATFGRHETFPLRYGWLIKGCQGAFDDPELFEADDATVRLGVGRNMVSAIKYWMTASDMADVVGGKVRITELGHLLFGSEGWDPYLEDDTTLWLLHWLIASNARVATAVFWFFNQYHKTVFTSAELARALTEFCRENCASRYAAVTLRKDVSMLLRMYVASSASNDTAFEDSLDSPMADLGLIARTSAGKDYSSVPELRWRLPVAAFGYAVAELFDAINTDVIPVHQFCHSDEGVAAPGCVFRLTNEGTIGKLEELARFLPENFEIRETAGIHQVYNTRRIRPLDVIRIHYESKNKMEIAA